jgi:DNA-binding LytR/AlgR family response regulator
MRPVRCIAIDDEPLALTVLSEYVSRVSFLQMVNTFTNPADASHFIQTEKPEILFLDIQMPDIKGVDFIKTFVYKPIIILTTAYSEYAIEGYDLDVIDYLLKPIPFERFLQAINKAIRHIDSENSSDQTNEKQFLFVKSGYKSVKINFNDILYIEGLKEYVTIYTNEHKALKLETLKNLESLLPEKEFIRVHKSYIVNINHVRAYYGNVLEINNKSIPIGRAFKGIVNKLFQ